MSWVLIAILAAAAGIAMWQLHVRIWEPLRRSLNRIRRMAGLPETSVAVPRLERLARELESSVSAAEINMEMLNKRLSHGDFSQQAILGSMIEGVMMTDPSSRFLLVNDAFRDLFQQREGLIGMTVLSTLRNSAIHEAVRKAAEGARVVDVEIEYAEAPGRTLLMSAHPIEDEQGKVSGVVAIFRDHTRLKRLEQSRREFVENVSHELRTPLSIIQGYIETILDHPNLERRELETFLTTAKKHSDRLTELVGDLLTISKLEAAEAAGPKVEAGALTCSVKETLEKAVADLSRMAEKKKIKVVAECRPSIRDAAIDSAHLEQVLFNLLDNAIKYTPEGGRVTAEASENNGQIMVCVADTGTGIPESSLPHVFERFYRADRSRSREDGGTGLGLSIVKHIVQSNGGKVWAESRVGEGSRFYFTLKPAS
jgi:two-component system, OmpR family, phosphate regulon sensor histidine kinase PhoR